MERRDIRAGDGATAACGGVKRAPLGPRSKGGNIQLYCLLEARTRSYAAQMHGFGERAGMVWAPVSSRRPFLDVTLTVTQTVGKQRQVRGNASVLGGRWSPVVHPNSGR